MIIPGHKKTKGTFSFIPLVSHNFKNLSFKVIDHVPQTQIFYLVNVRTDKIKQYGLN